MEALALEEVVSSEWIRCPTCGNGLWRTDGETIVVAWSPRGGQRASITIKREVGWAIKRRCEKCGASSAAGPMPPHTLETPEAQVLLAHVRKHLMEEELR